MSFKSQYGQDEYLDFLLKQKKNGYFVELGACDGVLYSNSYYFEKELGWNGILIEPNPIYWEDLNKNRNCNISNKICDDVEGKEISFVLADAMSGILNDNPGYWVKQHINNNKINLITSTLSSVLDEFNAPNIIDFLSLDVEGTEFSILKTFPFDKYKFSYICVEHNNYWRKDGNKKEIQDVLIKNGYILIKETNIDDFFINGTMNIQKNTTSVELDINQKTHHKEHYYEILDGGVQSYDGFLNRDSIWYWMHTYCMEHISEFFEKIPTSSFLTVGDGYCGREASYIKKFGHKVHASDIETCLIELAFDKGNIDEYSKQDMNKLSFEDNFFDYSLVKESLHHLSRPYLGLYEMLRVSKNGVILIEPNGELDKDYSSRNFEPSGNYSFSFTSNELIKIGLSCGYKNFLITYSNMFYGQHNMENISAGNIEYEKDRLIDIDKNLNPINKPLLIFMFLKNGNILNDLEDKFKKIII